MRLKIFLLKNRNKNEMNNIYICYLFEYVWKFLYCLIFLILILFKYI